MCIISSAAIIVSKLNMPRFDCTFKYQKSKSAVSCLEKKTLFQKKYDKFHAVGAFAYTSDDMDIL